MFSFNDNLNFQLPPSGDPNEDFRISVFLVILYVLTFFAGIGICGVLGLVYYLITV